MNCASNHLQSECRELEVWLDLGRNGRCFKYLDGRYLGVDVGDVVLVRLRGRPMKGIVLKSRLLSGDQIKRNFKEGKAIKYEFVDELLESAAFDPSWSDWIQIAAKDCYVSPFKMLKTALPPGLLSKRNRHFETRKSFWWVYLKKESNVKYNLSPRQKILEQFLIERGGGIWQKDIHNNGFSGNIIQGLIKNERADKEKRFMKEEKDHNFNEAQTGSSNTKIPLLTEEQTTSINIFSSLPVGGSMLLWGVTGSGKTEVYLQITSKIIETGASGLILAPEIGLIPQLVDRFRERFGERVFEYHSGCSDKERVKTWQKAKKSFNPIIVVGTRSAIFLPFQRLSLIVLDEEHDSSYKQESPMPCYNARDLALDRVKRFGARLVLGSATPSLNTWKSLQPRGPIALARLTRRISDRPLPNVFIVDMRNEFAEGHRQLISRYLMKEIEKLPEKGEQAIVLVPRRGYNSFLSCRSCGEVVQCPNCDVALTVHKNKTGSQWLRCHWCDYRSSFTSNCLECGSTAFKPFGAGTQRVLEKLFQEMKGLRFLRFDRDTTGGRDGHRRILEQFAAGEADVLIGTQMLAKGIDLPNVTLAAVIAADGLLHRPDLKACEQSLQLFMQLAGRAGRGNIQGKVIIQTYCPEHPVIRHLKDGRYEEFLKTEEKIRKAAGLVPYSRACLIRISGESPALIASTAAVIAGKLKKRCDCCGWDMIGPTPAAITKVAGKIRWQLLLHGPCRSELPLPNGLSLWDDLPKGVSVSVDPDPIQL